MPAYNEQEGIGEFLEELVVELAAFDVRFVVVDDCSTDNTAAVVDALVLADLPVELVRCEANGGHGAATLRALRAGLALRPEAVVAVDGDGQFFGSDIAAVVEQLFVEDCDVVEGARIRRAEPWFRRVTTVGARALVRIRCGQSPSDPNTPLRAYRTEALRKLLACVPTTAMTPNLEISALSRIGNLRVLEQEVTHRCHRGGSIAGSTWAARRKNVPSRTFLRFCGAAVLQWVMSSLRSSVGRRTSSAHDWSLAAPAALMALGYLLYAYMVPIGGDSGVFMYCGQSLLHGGAPYVDCWDHKGPLLYLFNAAGMAVGGPRGVLLLEGTLLTCSLAIATRLWVRVANRRVALLVGLSYAIAFLTLGDCGNLTETWASAFVLMGYSLFAYVELTDQPPKYLPAVTLGVAGAVGLMTRPNNGVGLIIVALALIAWSRRRARVALAVAGGASCVCVPTLLFLAARGSLHGMWQQYVEFNIGYGSATPSARLAALGTLCAVIALTPLPFAVARLHVSRPVRGGKAPKVAGVLAAALVVDLLGQCLSGRAPLHYAAAVLPALAVYGVAVAALNRPEPRSTIRAAVRLPLSALLIADLMLSPWVLWGRWHDVEYQSATLASSPLHVASAAIDKRTDSGEKVLVFGADTRVLVAAHRLSPTTLTYLYPWVETEPNVRRYVRQVKATPPALVVLPPGQDSLVRFRCGPSQQCEGPQRQLHDLRFWLTQRYHLVESVAGYRLWAPRAQSGGSSVQTEG